MDDHIYKHIHLTGSSTESMEQAVRAALVVAGVPLQQVLMRKPESTTGSGTDREARRVEIRIVDAP